MLSSLFKQKKSSGMAEVADLFTRTVEILVPELVVTEEEEEMVDEVEQIIE